MNEEFESDSNGFLPSNILAYIIILSLIGVILHSCAAKYMYRNFNMSKPIYKLMLSACISRLIQNGSKFQNWFFSWFKGRFIIFWKMMFGKMQKFFWYDHSKGCLKRPKVLLYNAPMWNGAIRLIQFFSVFSKTKDFCCLNTLPT